MTSPGYAYARAAEKDFEFPTSADSTKAESLEKVPYSRPINHMLMAGYPEETKKTHVVF